jgi:hypothetical protein
MTALVARRAFCVIALIALASCQDAMAPTSEKPSIVGEWKVVEFFDGSWDGNMAERHDVTLIYTEDGRYVATYDPPLFETVESNTGRYELLSGSRFMLIFMGPDGTESIQVGDYSVTATKLVLSQGDHARIVAKRIR